MAEMDELGLAALDLIIAKAKQDPTFITGIDTATVEDDRQVAHAVENLAQAAHNVADAVEAHAQHVNIDEAMTPVQAMNQETFVGVGDANAIADAVGGASVDSVISSDERARVAKGISLDELIALRERIREGKGS
jgi:NADH dehydrogenase FAD-containing subunit